MVLPLFKNKKLLNQALVHPSARVKKNDNSFERLEFLGDRVLGLVIAEELMLRHPSEKEGMLAKRFSKLVNKETCRAVFISIQGEKHIKANTKELKLVTSNIFSDACEALIGGYYLDSGLELVKAFILNAWQPYLDGEIITDHDTKTKLQEWIQKKSSMPPQYELVEKTGSDHEPIFKVSVSIPEYDIVYGVGPTKKIAEKNAAKELLHRISELG